MAHKDRHGLFVTFEGVDGAGKTTLMRLLAARAAAEGIGSSVVLTREPGGGGSLGEKLRALLLDPTLAAGATAQALMFYAARAHHLETLIRPALARGAWVFCDRFHDSTHAYQAAGLGAAEALLAALDRFVIGDDRPDLTILLDLPVEAAHARRQARGAPDDRFEAQPPEFARRLRAAFLARAAAEPGRIVTLDATTGPESLAERAWSLVEARGGVGR